RRIAIARQAGVIPATAEEGYQNDPDESTSGSEREECAGGRRLSVLHVPLHRSIPTLDANREVSTRASAGHTIPDNGFCRRRFDVRRRRSEVAKLPVRRPGS